MRSPTEHGDRYVSSAPLICSIERVWPVVASVERWPAWNPLVEWSSGEIHGRASDNFTLLMARTLLAAKLVSVMPERYLHCRCTHAGQTQPPAVDISVGVVQHAAQLTTVMVELHLEPWFGERLEQTVRNAAPNPALLFVRALRRVVERPGAAMARAAGLTGLSAVSSWSRS